MATMVFTSIIVAIVLMVIGVVVIFLTQARPKVKERIEKQQVRKKQVTKLSETKKVNEGFFIPRRDTQIGYMKDGELRYSILEEGEECGYAEDGTLRVTLKNKDVLVIRPEDQHWLKIAAGNLPMYFLVEASNKAKLDQKPTKFLEDLHIQRMIMKQSRRPEDTAPSARKSQDSGGQAD